MRVQTENINLNTKLCLNIFLSFSMSHIDCLSNYYIFYINIFSLFNFKEDLCMHFTLVLKVYGLVHFQKIKDIELIQFHYRMETRKFTKFSFLSSIHFQH